MGNQSGWGFHEFHFTGPRLRHYLTACAGDQDRAINLYRWNAEVSAELWKALGHLEVSLRNALDRQMTARQGAKRRDGHWIFDDARELGRDSGRGTARHAFPYADVATAIVRVRNNGKPVSPGQAISELPFGFWHQLVSKRQMFLWPDLVAAFPHMPGRRQGTVSDRIGRLRSLRNRIGHHHRVWALDLDALYSDLLTVVEFIDPALSEWIDAQCDVRALLSCRP